MNPRLIVALDYHQQNEAFALVDKLDPESCALKIGNEMFTLFGPIFVKTLVAKNFNIFLDLKFHDIPNTVVSACKAAADLGVWMMNVHASGGLDMMQAAKQALENYKEHAPLLIAVTVLTSMSAAQLKTVGVDNSLINQVSQLANLAKLANLDGVVCSAHEVPIIKSSANPSFLTVTPGIRTPESPINDQFRTMTPQEAITTGSDYLVIGRPITKATNPQEVIKSILTSLSIHK